MSGSEEIGSTSRNPTTETSDWFVVCQGFSTVKWKDYLRNTHGMHWDEVQKFWVIGCLDEARANALMKDIHRHTRRGQKAQAPFSVWKDRGGDYGTVTHPAPAPEYHEDWKAVADRAREFLVEGRGSGLISRKEELGYMGAIAIIQDRKSRPADKKAAIDLIMRLEGIFEDRNKGLEEGDEAEGTQALLEKLGGSDGSD